MTEILMARQDDVDAASALSSATAAAASAAAAAADVILTAADVVSTNADVVLTNADVVLTNADVVSTNADAAATAIDAAATAADAIATAADVVSAAASAASAAAASQNPALHYTYSTTTSQGAATGTVRFSETTFSGALNMFIADTDADSGAQQTYITTWDDSTSSIRGIIYVCDVIVPSVSVFQVVGANTDNASDTTVSLSFIGGSSTLPTGDGATLSVLFVPAGDAGAGLADIVDDLTPQLGGPLDGQGEDLTNMGVLFLTEQAAAEADVAGKGQFWVLTATPNVPRFTDDAGTDFALVTGGGAFHDGFSDFVADEHVAHTGVTLTAGEGLTGGGDISANRTFDLDFSSLDTDTIVAADVLAFYDATGAHHNKVTLTALSTALGVIGDFQPADADLDTWAGVTPGANVATFLATPSSANLAAAVTDETGSGALAFATSPTFVTPTLGAASATSLVTTGAIDVGHATDTTLDRFAAGKLGVEGEELLVAQSDVNEQTGTTYTLVLGDAGHTVTMSNASANTLTIPPVSSVDFPPGTMINVIMLGAGVTSIGGGTGVTLNGISTGTGAMTTQYQAVSLLHTDTDDTWIASGDIGTVA